MSQKQQLYRVGRLRDYKWAIEIDRNYPIGNDWHTIARHSSRRLLLIVVFILNRLDKDPSI